VEEESEMLTRVLRALALLLLPAMATAIAPPAQAAPGPAPAFALELFNGQTLRLADLKGTAVILLFWANW
jgi:hypothetical protein